MYRHSSRYLCSCDYDPTRPVFGASAPARLPDLFFCPKCVAARCTACAHPAVVAKYCAHCTADYSDSVGTTRCTRNCFECPECTLPVTVSAQDVGPGKQFDFACVHCPYRYVTAPVARPAPLLTILRRENPSFYTKLSDHYALLHKLRELRELEVAALKNRRRLPHVSLSKTQRSLLVQMSGSPASEVDALQIKVDAFEPRRADVVPDAAGAKRVPLGRHLTAKTEHTCACGTVLVRPVADPRLLKFLIRELAPDYVPVVAVARRPVWLPYEAETRDHEKHDGPDETECTLSIVNPLASPVTVTLAVLQNPPVELTKVPVTIALPVTRVEVNGRRETKTLEAVPSVYLTAATAASRGELLQRAISRDKQQTPLLDSGANWVSVPMHLGSDAPLPTDGMRVPLHVLIEAKAPEAVKYYGAAALKYSFWVICDVEP